MNEEFNVPIAQLIASTILLYSTQSEVAAKIFAIKQLTVWLQQYPVPQHSYDEVFKLAMGDTEPNHQLRAYVLYQRASRHLQANYRITLINRGHWIRIQHVAAHMKHPLSHDEIVALGKTVCNSKSLVERTSFHQFVSEHPRLPSFQKRLVDWNIGAIRM